MVDQEIIELEALKGGPRNKENFLLHLVVDRIVVQGDDESVSRFGDSVQTALQIGHGHCLIWDPDTKNSEEFSTRFEADGMEFEEPSEHLFSFNNPVGACPSCEGYGKVMGIDEDLVVPDKRLSVYEDAVVCWKGEKMKKWKEKLVMKADQLNFPIHTPYFQLSEDERKLLWKGNRHFRGIDRFFAHLEEKKYKIQYRVMLSRYRGKTVCPECSGSRLRKEASYVKLGGRIIPDLVKLPISELQSYFKDLNLSKKDLKVVSLR